jgi:hypothetical protein
MKKSQKNILIILLALFCSCSSERINGVRFKMGRTEKKTVIVPSQKLSGPKGLDEAVPLSSLMIQPTDALIHGPGKIKSKAFKSLKTEGHAKISFSHPETDEPIDSVRLKKKLKISMNIPIVSLISYVLASVISLVLTFTGIFILSPAFEFIFLLLFIIGILSSIIFWVFVYSRWDDFIKADRELKRLYKSLKAVNIIFGIFTGISLLIYLLFLLLIFILFL